jgi:hypothetical protein
MQANLSNPSWQMRINMDVAWKEVYGSTHIDAAKYDPETKKLSIRFIGGSEYSYLGVPPEVWAEFQSSTSKGRFVGVKLRREYEAVKEA